MKQVKNILWIGVTVSQMVSIVGFALNPESPAWQNAVVILTIWNILFSTLDLRGYIREPGRTSLNLGDMPMIEAVVALILAVVVAILPGAVLLGEMAWAMPGFAVILLSLLLLLAKSLRLW